jgi:hypothetical protein
LYVTIDGENAVRAYNVRDLAAGPVPVGDPVQTGGQAAAVAVAGGRAYVVNYPHGLQAFDVSDSTRAPVPLGRLVTTGEAPFAVALAGNRAYVVCGASNTLQAYDLRPGQPQLLGKAAVTVDNPYHVAVRGARAYVVTSVERYTLQTFDLSGAAAYPATQGAPAPSRAAPRGRARP